MKSPTRYAKSVVHHKNFPLLVAPASPDNPPGLFTPSLDKASGLSVLACELHDSTSLADSIGNIEADRPVLGVKLGPVTKTALRERRPKLAGIVTTSQNLVGVDDGITS